MLIVGTKEVLKCICLRSSAFREVEHASDDRDGTRESKQNKIKSGLRCVHLEGNHRPCLRHTWATASSRLFLRYNELDMIFLPTNFSSYREVFLFRIIELDFCSYTDLQKSR